LRVAAAVFPSNIYIYIYIYIEREREREREREHGPQIGFAQSVGNRRKKAIESASLHRMRLIYLLFVCFLPFVCVLFVRKYIQTL
jgi:hypothetical protein